MGTTWDVFCLKEHTGLFFKKKEKRSGKWCTSVLLEHDFTSFK
jgi:hypothetical protein